MGKLRKWMYKLVCFILQSTFNGNCKAKTIIATVNHRLFNILGYSNFYFPVQSELINFTKCIKVQYILVYNKLFHAICLTITLFFFSGFFFVVALFLCDSLIWIHYFLSTWIRTNTVFYWK